MAKQADIDAANWAGPGWPGPPPTSPDEGFGPQATGFSISQISLLHQVSGGPGNDYTFTIKDPAGNIVAVINPTGPGAYPVPVNIPNGMGIWTIEIDRQPHSSVAPPAFEFGGPPGNLVKEPCVFIYGDRSEGILGLEFTGDEIFESCCPNLTLAPPQVSQCAERNPTASFAASLTWPKECTAVPPTIFVWTLNGPTGQFQKTTSSPNTDTVSGWAKTGASAPPLIPVDLSQPGSYSISVLAIIPGVPSNCFPVSTLPLVVPTCNCPVLTGLTATPATSNAPLTVNFQAGITTPGAIVPDGQGNRYHWDFGDGTSDHTQNPNTSHTYSTAGTFTVTVTVNVPPGCQAVVAATTVVITSPPVCPSLTGLTATPATGSAPLTVNFQAGVNNSNAIVPDGQQNKYHWDFGDGTSDHTPGPTTSHTYTSTGPFTATVRITVPEGCPASEATANINTVRPPTNGGFNFCAFMLIVSMILLGLGTLMIIIGVCLKISILVIIGSILV
ncbi:MAG: PKD domain-containing protein [Phaeodactylibacter sp.]|nr:PKD domain-containing protein [Phaeodactylibacter sp.]